MIEIIAEAECPTCGEMMEFENLGEKLCECKEMIGVLTVNWLVSRTQNCLRRNSNDSPPSDA